METKLRILLAEQKKKMSDAIKDTGLSKTAIRGLYYETAKGVNFQTLEKLCDYLECSVGDILLYRQKKGESA